MIKFILVFGRGGVEVEVSDLRKERNYLIKRYNELLIRINVGVNYKGKGIMYVWSFFCYFFFIN